MGIKWGGVLKRLGRQLVRKKGKTGGEGNRVESRDLQKHIGELGDSNWKRTLSVKKDYIQGIGTCIAGFLVIKKMQLPISFTMILCTKTAGVSHAETYLTRWLQVLRVAEDGRRAGSRKGETNVYSIEEPATSGGPCTMAAVPSYKRNAAATRLPNLRWNACPTPTDPQGPVQQT